MPHRHVHLIQGRAKYAQVYPRLFSERLCEGIAAQKRLDELGLRSRPIMSVDEMVKAANTDGGSDCPSAALHEPDTSQMVAVDDVSGQRLDPALMIQARREEIKYFKQMGVYEKVNIAECWAETGKAPIGVVWAIVNKGDLENPEIRARLCVTVLMPMVVCSIWMSSLPAESRLVIFLCLRKKMRR